MTSTRKAQQTPSAVYEAANAFASACTSELSGSDAINSLAVGASPKRACRAAVDRVLDTAKHQFVQAYLAGFTAATKAAAEAKAVESNPYHRVIETLRWARTKAAADAIKASDAEALSRRRVKETLRWARSPRP